MRADHNAPQSADRLQIELKPSGDASADESRPNERQRMFPDENRDGDERLVSADLIDSFFIYTTDVSAAKSSSATSSIFTEESHSLFFARRLESCERLSTFAGD